MKKVYLSMLIAASVLIVVSCEKSMDKMPDRSAADIVSCSPDDASASTSRLVRVSEAQMAAAQDQQVLSIRVDMYPRNEVPSIPTRTKSTRGLATLTLTSDSMLYSIVKVKGLSALAGAGSLTMAHVHEGAAGVTGPVRIFLAHNAGEFNVPMMQKLTGAQYDLLLTGICYTNAHSTGFPSGVVRGQIR